MSRPSNAVRITEKLCEIVYADELYYKKKLIFFFQSSSFLEVRKDEYCHDK